MTLRFDIEPVRPADGKPREAERRAVERLVCRLLGDGAVVTHLPSGAPVTEGCHISVSHCRTHAAVAVSTAAPVGIDIEETRRCKAHIVSRVAHPDDSPALSPAQAWCAKEAVFKAALIDDLTLADIAVSPVGATTRGRSFDVLFPAAPEGLCIALAYESE